MRELPPDLTRLSPDELSVQVQTRDDRLTILFRRWPKLARAELGDLRRLYSERLRLARYLGERRRRSSPRD
jgi:hypothetical protein